LGTRISKKYTFLNLWVEGTAGIEDPALVMET